MQSKWLFAKQNQAIVKQTQTKKLNKMILSFVTKQSMETAKLIDSFVKGVTDAGHQAEVICLVKNEVKLRLSCFFSCHKGTGCIQNDNFNSIVPKMK